MKRLNILLAFLMAFGMSWAQETVSLSESNRVLINTQSGTRGFMTERITDIQFGRVDGDVKAELNILKNEPDSLLVSVYKSDECVAYRLGVMPAVTYRAFRGNQAAIIDYMLKNNATSTFYDDYDRANLSGLELEPGTEYVLMTIGIDVYGIDCDLSVRNFTTQAADILGNPKVEVNVTETTTKTISFTATPNADCSAYYFVIYEEGQVQEQFDMYAPMFGFKNISEMIMGWGSRNEGPISYQYKDMTPGTNYELVVVCLDKQGHPAVHQIFAMSTKAQGGTGTAYTSAAVTGYRKTDWGGQMLPCLFVKFTPNAETLAYRFAVVKASDFNASEVESELAQEPPMPNMMYWFWYDEFETDFQVNPSTEVVICTKSKNANGQWGPMNTVRYTTPATVTGVSTDKVQHAPKPMAAPQQPNKPRQPRKVSLQRVG